MKYLIVLSAALLLCAGESSCFAQSAGQSLADLVKNSKSGKKEAIRLTDEDFPPARSEAKAADNVTNSSQKYDPMATAASVSNPSAGNKSEDKSAAGDVKKDGVEQLQQKLAFYHQQEETWSSSARDYEDKLAKETSEFRRNTYRGALENDRKNVGYYRQKITDTEAQLAKAKPAEATESHYGQPEDSDRAPEARQR